MEGVSLFFDGMAVAYPVLCSAKRTPHGLFGGQLATKKASSWAAEVIRQSFQDFERQVHPHSVILGCVLSAGLGQAPARQALIEAGLPSETQGMLVNKVCGSGMMAVIQASLFLRYNPDQLIFAGGMESMSGAPYLLAKERFGQRFGHGSVRDHLLGDGLEDPYEGLRPMGILAETLADVRNYRKELQDVYARASARRALQASESNYFDAEIVPIKGKRALLTKDETLEKVDLDKIIRLKPAFREGGSITAATSSSLADGAALLGVTSEDYAQKHDLPVRAYIRGWTSFSGAPEDFTVAPIHAVQQVLNEVEWSVNDVDAWEVNEAFAVVPMALQDTLSVPRERLNIWGGALALGHPLGASGARILVTLISILERIGGKRGIASICIGGGEGLAMAIERA